MPPRRVRVPAAGVPLSRRFYKDVAGWYARALQRPHEPARDSATGGQDGNQPISSRAGFFLRVLTRLTFARFLQEMGVLPGEMFSTPRPEQVAAVLRGAVSNLSGLPSCFDELNPSLAPELLFGDGSPPITSRAGRPPCPAGLVEILSRYQFTVDETAANETSTGEASSSALAINPGILGTILESLLASCGQPGRLSVRRAAGAFYTPRVIVDYMVAESLREYLAVQVPDVPQAALQALFASSPGSAPQSSPLSLPQREALVMAISRVRILDPACGAGAFLLGALQRLVSLLEQLDPHNDLWQETQLAAMDQRRARSATAAELAAIDDAAREMAQAFDTGPSSADYARKTYLVANCLHGVDIEPLACEITALRLWLAVHCGQPRDSLKTVEPSWELPRLAAQIRVADVLQEGLPAIESAVPFDIVLCNPPYRKERDGKALIDQVRQTAWGRRYHAGKMDYWYFFMHRALELTRPGGTIAFITSRYWLASSGTAKLLAHIRTAAVFTQIVDIGKLDVFDDVAGQHLIHFYRRQNAAIADSPVLIKSLRHDLSALSQHTASPDLEIHHRLNSDLFARDGRISLSAPRVNIVGAAALGERYLVSQGVVQNPDRVSARAAARFNLVRNTGVFVLDEAELPGLGLTTEERAFLRPFYDESEFSRYALTQPPRRFLLYLTRENCPSLAPYPNLERHLRRFEPIMQERRETRHGKLAWFHLHWPRAAGFFEGPHVLFPNMFRTPLAALVDQPAYVGMGSSVIISRDPEHSLGFLTALLNSEVAAYWFREHGKQRGVGMDVGVQRLRDYPLPASTRAQRDLVENIVELLPQTSVVALEQLLNGLAYELYFPAELHAGGLRLFDALNGTHWPDLIASSPNSLTSSALAVHDALKALQSLEIVRKIRD